MGGLWAFFSVSQVPVFRHDESKENLTLSLNKDNCVQYPHVTFRTQSELDDFGTCAIVSGDLIIDGFLATTLVIPPAIQEIHGSLIIRLSPAVQSINASKLTAI